MMNVKKKVLYILLFCSFLYLFSATEEENYMEKLSSSVLKDMEEIKMEIIDEYRNEREITELELAHKELLLARQSIFMRYYTILFVLIAIFMIIVLNQSRYAQRNNKKLGMANEELSIVNEQLKKLATTDPLTNLSNRRDMIDKIEHEQQRFARNGKSFVLIMSDIDDFKHINDKYGHDGGDFVLTSIAYLMKSAVRKQDIVGRWGGEEFLLLLPETDLAGGKALAEKIRKNIYITPYIFSDNKIPVTITFGVTIYDRKMNMDDCIRIADRALYRGKRSGKNCVVIGKYGKDISDNASAVFYDNEIDDIT